MTETINESTSHRRRRDRIREYEDACEQARDPNIDFTNEDLIRKREALELELREEKATTQKKMAWMSMFTMLIFTIALFLPIFPDSRIDVLGDILGLFYIAQAGVVGAFMGVQAWMNRR